MQPQRGFSARYINKCAIQIAYSRLQVICLGCFAIAYLTTMLSLVQSQRFNDNRPIKHRLVMPRTRFGDSSRI
jgi:hypothetical protein